MSQSKKQYMVSYGEQWEPSYDAFVCEDEELAQWYCDQMNQCNDAWDTYYCHEYNAPEILSEEHLKNYQFEFGFSFDENTFELVGSDHYTHDEAQGYSKALGLILLDGKGSTYLDAKLDAEMKLEAFKSIPADQWIDNNPDEEE